MKKPLAIILSGALMLGSLYGCGENSDDGGNGEKNYSQVTSYEESTLDEGADLQKELNVPDRFQDTWKSNSGITIITVDAAVQFPESVSKVPVIEVKPRNMTKEDLFAFCDAAFEGKTYTPVVYDGHTNKYHNVSKEKLKLNSDILLTFDGEETYYSGYYKDNLPIYTAVTDLREYNHTICFQRAYASLDVSYTRDSARSYANELVNQFSPGLECVSEKEYTVDFTIGKADNLSDDSPGEEQEQLYEFIFNRPYNGISTTYTMLECSETDGNPDGYAPSSYYESVRVSISESGLSEMEWKQPYEQAGTISENPKLLSFDEAMQTAAQMLPLKWAYHEHTWEETTSKNITVESITFGYTRVLMKDAPTRYMMVPVWDFFGYFEASDTNKSENYSLLTLNAIDGSVIDREYGY